MVARGLISRGTGSSSKRNRGIVVIGNRGRVRHLGPGNRSCAGDIAKLQIDCLV